MGSQCCAASSPVGPSDSSASGARPTTGTSRGVVSKSAPTSRRNSAVRSLAAASAVVVDVNGKTVEPKKKSLFVRSASHRGRMTALAMSFPKIRRSFMAVQNVFNQYCIKKGNDKKELSLDKLGTTLNAICSHKQFSDQEIRELFRQADLSGSRSISFREFLIAVGVGYFLKINVPDNKAYSELQSGFRVVEKAFNDMDTDKSGSVDAKEMKTALFSLGDHGSATDGTSHRSLDILEERFAELDFDGDGNIRFPEFLYGFFSWVGMDDDGDTAPTAGGGADGNSPISAPLPNRVIDSNPAAASAGGGAGAISPVGATSGGVSGGGVGVGSISGMDALGGGAIAIGHDPSHAHSGIGATPAPSQPATVKSNNFFSGSPPSAGSQPPGSTSPPPPQPAAAAPAASAASAGPISPRTGPAKVMSGRGAGTGAGILLLPVPATGPGAGSGGSGGGGAAYVADPTASVPMNADAALALAERNAIASSVATEASIGILMRAGSARATELAAARANAGAPLVVVDPKRSSL